MHTEILCTTWLHLTDVVFHYYQTHKLIWEDFILEIFSFESGTKLLFKNFLESIPLSGLHVK